MIIPFIMKYHQPVSIAQTFRPFLACTLMLKPAAKHTTCVTMDGKVIRAHHFYAPTAPFSIKRNLLAIGGIMLTVLKQPPTTGKNVVEFPLFLDHAGFLLCRIFSNFC